ncbi:uncharacterized protein A4U43_C04F18220 [Asparagus officinalis]|uniref:Uncharacterized protein n=1 Tax=Asparagus officinalis TaxID=4686 RepID=A0A5P1F757_ASPOF|nr:uncharacterized protein A4U43_C04F18220 [Asparagus officinalis]
MDGVTRQTFGLSTKAREGRGAAGGHGEGSLRGSTNRPWGAQLGWGRSGGTMGRSWPEAISGAAASGGEERRGCGLLWADLGYRGGATAEAVREEVLLVEGLGGRGLSSLESGGELGCRRWSASLTVEGRRAAVRRSTRQWSERMMVVALRRRSCRRWLSWCGERKVWPGVLDGRGNLANLLDWRIASLWRAGQGIGCVARPCVLMLMVQTVRMGGTGDGGVEVVRVDF